MNAKSCNNKLPLIQRLIFLTAMDMFLPRFHYVFTKGNKNEKKKLEYCSS